MNNKKTDWRVATDSKTGREYYYNKVTKESTWTKPIELASDKERYIMELKKKETSDFFKEMENNIHKTFTKAKKASEFDDSLFTELNAEEMYEFDEDHYDDNMDGHLSNSVNSYPEGNIEEAIDAYNNRQRRGSLGGIRLVRTISSIDDEIMELMKRTTRSGSVVSEYDLVGRAFAASPNSPFGEYRRNSGALFNNSPGTGSTPVGIAMGPTRVRGMSKDGITNLLASPSGTTRKRRNSTGTLYIDSTMSQQDNKATMRCVCAVIRTLMIDAEKESIVPRPQFNIFKDEYFVKLEKKHKEQNSQYDEASPEIFLCAADRKLPSLATIVTFFENTFSKSQMESECIIMSLIYIERLIDITKGRFCIRFDNWRSTSFACMIMASKVWDDLSMWNVDFSQISESFDLQRINELELAMLDALHYEVKVPAGEYAKYYFHLRSMIARLGYHRRRKSELLPLNINGAKKLQLATEEYANTKLIDADSQGGETRSRARTMANGVPPAPSLLTDDSGDSALPMAGKIHRFKSEDCPVQEGRRNAVLEHLLHDTHIHGDGENSISVAAKKKRMLHHCATK